MKTKEEVFEHLKKNGYSQVSGEKIMGFLLGQGIIEKGEVVEIRKGNYTFNDFYEWFEREEKITDYELRGLIVSVVRGDTRFQILCLSNCIDGKLLGFNGRVIKVYELDDTKIEFANEDEIASFYSKMTEKGFGYLNEFGFFLLEELEIKEGDEEGDDCECNCPFCRCFMEEDK